MKILVLEDRGSVISQVAATLRDRDHLVSDVLSINDAKEEWDNHKNEIDCLIVDLNMRNDGLTEEEASMTKGGLLTGWVWLKNYVYKDRPDLKTRTIIYTEYLDELRAKVSEAELDGIRCVKKGADSAEMVLSYLREISLQ